MTTFQSGVSRKFKYVSAKELINHDCLFNLKPSTAAPAIACSPTRWATPYASGGGGPVFLGGVGEAGKVEPTEAPRRCLGGHRAPAHAVAFSPFHDALLATAGDDCRVRLYDVAAVEDAAAADLEGGEIGSHGSGCRALAFHPSAEHVLLSAAGKELGVWDVEARASLAKTTLPAAVHAIDWARGGGGFLASCRDKAARFVDARTGTTAWSCEPHGGARAFRSVWAGGARLGGDYVLSAGGARRGGREVALLDPRKYDEPLHRALVDSQTGDLLPFWDEDSSVLWLGGKGDAMIKHFEVDVSGATSDETLHAGVPWSSASPAGPAAAICMLPKQCCDVAELEVAAFLRLTTSTVERVTFSVSRTAELKTFFNDDLFPETRARVGGLDAAAWSSGEDAAPVLEGRNSRNAPLLSERRVAAPVLHTAVVNDRLATEKQLKENDDAAMDRLSQLADMYANHNVNRSMGAKPGVDALAVDGGEVDSDEWDDSD
mmetsp:Transcript_36110/g.111727  ORF Transcript_36110/g.111727 Transcript_36110/m.111727 type:complete len:489 (-) Transcript_36110:183-1649(-)